MKLSRLGHNPGMLIDLFEEGLTVLGAVCDRSWHDRLDLVAEARAASLWNGAGELVEKQLRFVPADAAGARNTDAEVFPGCPLTFRLAEALRPEPLPIERAALQPIDQGRAPATDVVEKLWRAQVGPCARWQMERAFHATWHFCLLLLVRCEIQAIDQHWSLHRLALTLADGQPDADLAQQLDFAQVNPRPEQSIDWPRLDLRTCLEQVQDALLEELAGDLAGIRARQEAYLRRELDRIDDYFENYERELQQRAARSRSNDSHLKMADRLAAARIEHERRRHDQIQRYQIRIVPHFDAFLLAAEPAWGTVVSFSDHRDTRRVAAYFLPRARRWFVHDQPADDKNPAKAPGPAAIAIARAKA